MSSASRITACPMLKRPPVFGALPTKTICARSSSTPDEQEATDEKSERFLPMSSAGGYEISPSATAIPSAAVPFDRFIDSSGSSVTTV